MKIHSLLFFASSAVLIISSGYQKPEVSASKPITDSIQTIAVKAKFIKKSLSEYCGYVHIPERNMFEIISFATGVLTKKLIEVEYYTGCSGNHLIQGQTYFIRASKQISSIYYQNIKTTSIGYKLISEQKSDSLP
jgi:hypothetical protein